MKPDIFFHIFSRFVPFSSPLEEKIEINDHRKKNYKLHSISEKIISDLLDHHPFNSEK